MRLNLGCGGKLLDGFVNVDLPGNWSGRPPDIEADISKPLPFDDKSADEIHAYHVVEHFYRWAVNDILRDWARVLKPRGTLVLECPCLDKIIRTYMELGGGAPERMTILGLYGDPAYRSVEMTHKWCYSVAELKAILADIGLQPASRPPQTHFPARDMRIEGIKP